MPRRDEDDVFDPTNIIPLPPMPEEPPDISDDGLGQIFLGEHAHKLRYVHLWGHWMLWNGQRWIKDDSRLTDMLCHQTLRTVAKREAVHLSRHLYKPKDSDSLSLKQAKKQQARRDAILATRGLKSFKTRYAALQMALPDRRVASVPDDWDGARVSHLLNTPGGTVNLKTGENYNHRPDDLITNITAVAPLDMATPTWTNFLLQITDNNQELISYLRRVLGYCLSGTTTEQALFFGYGTGANGKSVLLNTIASILGNYHTAAPIETFIASQYDRHPAELANLRGARLVTSSETEEGRRWAEARIKHLTGGERISARFMRQDFFEFTPQFKLLIIGNHKPKLRHVDEAIRRRFHLIPFTVTIPRERRDPDLSERLKPEWPGILHWMLAGYAEWQQGGLRTPQVVVDATAKYMAEEDAIHNWFVECCDKDIQSFTPIKELYESWEAWSRMNGEPTGPIRAFSSVLEQRSEVMQIEYKRSKSQRGFQRVKLKEI